MKVPAEHVQEVLAAEERLKAAKLGLDNEHELAVRGRKTGTLRFVIEYKEGVAQKGRIQSDFDVFNVK